MVIQIHSFKTGMVEVDRALLYHQESVNPLAYTGFLRSSKHRVLIPVTSYLIRHPKGTILVDTGWNKAVRHQAYKHLGYRCFVSKPYLPAGWAIDERLESLGLRPKDLDYVLLTHLDLDHVGGLEHVREAKKIWTSQTEWETAAHNRLRYMKSLWSGVEISTFQATGSQIFGRPARDIFGDQQVYLVATPGHSAGLTSVIIKNDKGDFIVLASDVGYAADSLERQKIPGVLADKAAAISSLMWLRDLSNYPQCRGIYFNHDSSKQDTTIYL